MGNRILFRKGEGEDSMVFIDALDGCVPGIKNDLKEEAKKDPSIKHILELCGGI